MIELENMEPGKQFVKRKVEDRQVGKWWNRCQAELKGKLGCPILQMTTVYRKFYQIADVV